MPDTKLLIQQADRKLEENDFAGARDDYREALMASGPQEILINLGVAENHERLHFIKTLRQKYPDSVKVHQMEIHCLMDIGHSRNALILVSQLLKRDDLSPEERLYFHEMRLRLSFVTQRYDHVLEDFAFSWNMAQQLLPPRPYAQVALLTIISENARELDTIPILETLASDDQYPLIIREYLAAKIEEIRQYLTAREWLRI